MSAMADYYIQVDREPTKTRNGRGTARGGPLIPFVILAAIAVSLAAQSTPEDAQSQPSVADWKCDSRIIPTEPPTS